MQAIEFESIVQDQTIPLPTPGVLSPGQPVRVVVMFEEKQPNMEAQQKAQQAAENLTAHETAHAAMQPDERLAALEPHPDAISELCKHPLVLPGFLPLSRDEAHDR